VASADTFEVNLEFTAKMTKIKIASVGVVKENVPERQVTQDRVDEDRKLLIEASIVRVMKHRRTLHHNELVIEATKMLASRFQPTPQSLKKRIERLIDADYLRRSESEASVYEYVA
jgi:cullin 3